jgi:hypothetical protein
MRPDTLMEPASVLCDKLRLLSLYADYPAGTRAKWLTGQISRRAAPRWKLSAGMWKLDLAASVGRMNEMILQEAVESDLLVISVSSLDQREPLLDQWLHSLVALKANRPVAGLLIGLLGDDEHEAGELEWTVHQLAVFARRTEMDFIWQWMGRDAMYETSWLTVILEQLLTRKESRSNPPPTLATPAGDLVHAGASRSALAPLTSGAGTRVWR